MKLYFNCSSGISGNMVVGALLDLGIDNNFLVEELEKLKLRNYKIKIRRDRKGTSFSVECRTEVKHRNLRDINNIIDSSTLPLPVKSLSKKIFLTLARAEAKVHRTTVNKIHFHEVGATDSIIDIVGASVLINAIDPEEVLCSAVSVGRGRMKCEHGTLPLPVPAVRELLKDFPLNQLNINTEITTPTGAAILKSVVSDFASRETVKIKKRGLGRGTKKLPIPNLLEAIIGEVKLDRKLTLEANIDDMNPELYPYVIERLISAGANEAFIQPLVMKKNRIGIMLTVICEPKIKDKILDIIFEETTTFGVRINKVQRVTLDRQIKQVKTKHGLLNVKIGKRSGRIITVSPEYESAKRLAKKKKIPLREIYSLQNREKYIFDQVTSAEEKKLRQNG